MPTSAKDPEKKITRNDHGAPMALQDARPVPYPHPSTFRRTLREDPHDPRGPELHLAAPVALEVDETPGDGLPAVAHHAGAAERFAARALDLPVEDHLPVEHR